MKPKLILSLALVLTSDYFKPFGSIELVNASNQL